MSGNIDIVGILRYMKEEMESANKPKRERREKPEVPHIDGKGLIALLQERRAENQMIDAFFKDIEKLGKKEEDKKKSPWAIDLSSNQVALLLVATLPIYLWFLSKFMGAH